MTSLHRTVMIMVTTSVMACSNCNDELSCTADDECAPSFVCLGDECRPGSPLECSDRDSDGYGVGDTRGCPLCFHEGRCADDCNDIDNAVSPGLSDTCDGVDNNCDGQIDEAVPCETSFDCPDEPPFFPSCEAGLCAYLTPIQIGAECAGSVACVGGHREARPNACF